MSLRIDVVRVVEARIRKDRRKNMAETTSDPA
jgi:hypothetical protein